jgi:hypothetical protein
MYKLYRVNTTIRFIKSFETYSELYAYCKARRGWISRILPDGSITPGTLETVSIMEYPDGFECEVWEDEEEA